MQDKKQLYQDNLTQKQVVNKGIAHSFWLRQFMQSANQDRLTENKAKKKNQKFCLLTKSYYPQQK